MWPSNNVNYYKKSKKKNTKTKSKRLNYSLECDEERDQKLLEPSIKDDFYKRNIFLSKLTYTK